MKNLLQVWSSGGGVQSCAIAALIIQGKLPKPDYAVIADTGRERQTTWDYSEKWVMPALRLLGVELHRAKATEYCALKNEIFAASGDLLVPAFTTEFGDVGKLSAFCSGHWKVRTVNNFLSREFGVTRSKYCKWIGFSRDETRRVLRLMDGEEYRSGLLRFPLVHDIATTRQEAISLVKQVGWPTPPRSACWMCPNQGDHEWRDLKDESPLEFEAAVQLEREMQIKDSSAWLHKSCTPLSKVDFTKPEDLFTRACDSGQCFL
jgi:hypothetical protein